MKRQRYMGIRIGEEAHDKFQYIAAYEGRSMSGQSLYLIQRCIREFERKHGPIGPQQLEELREKK